MPDNNPFTTPVSGSRLDALSTKRQMKVYAITDSDLDLLRVANTVATGSLAISSFLAAILWDMWSDYSKIVESATKETTKNLMIGLSVFLIVSVIVGILAFCTRFGKYRQIKKSEVISELESGESRETPQP